MSKNLFVIGTGTDVGKTYVTGLLLKKLNEANIRVAYYKAAMSGNDRDSEGTLIPGDALNVKTASGISQDLNSMCPYIYENAVSPHLAAKIEHQEVDMDKVYSGFNSLTKDYDYVTMEGSGGILCPIRFGDQEVWLYDIIENLHLPVILIADAGLGTINTVGLTTEFLKSRGIKLNGIIFNNYEENNIMHEDNLKMCEYITGTKVIAKVKKNDTDIDIDINLLLSMYE